MSVSSLLTNVCDLYRSTSVAGTYGGHQETWTLLASGVLTSVQTITPYGAQVAYEALGSYVTDRFYFDHDPSLTVKDKIVYGGIDYFVRAVIDQAGKGVVWCVVAERKPMPAGS